MKKFFSGIASGLLYLVSLLPFSVIYLLADFLYFILVYVVRYRKDVVYQNLKNSFPEKTEDERKRIAKRYFHFLADQILETMKMRTISKEEMARRYKFKGLEVFDEQFAKGKSVLIATGHYGNWEWGTLAMAMAFKQKVLVVYKPLSDKNFGEVLNGMRSRFGSVLIPMKQTLRKIIEHKNETTVSIFVSDQTPAWEDTHHFTQFLNQPTAVFMGIEKIGKMTNNPIVFCVIDRVKRGYYEARFELLVAEPKQTADFEITDLHTKALERQIEAKPELWLWSHRRWKFKPEDFNR